MESLTVVIVSAAHVRTQTKVPFKVHPINQLMLLIRRSRRTRLQRQQPCIYSQFGEHKHRIYIEGNHCGEEITRLKVK